MPARRLASLRTQKLIQDVNQANSADLEIMNLVGPYGKSHLAVRPLGCSDGSLLAANMTPGLAPEPGSQIPVGRPGGGSSLVAFPAVGLSGGGSTRVAKQEDVAPAPATEAPLIALKMTAFDSGGTGDITVDIASFTGQAFVETLHTGAVVKGLNPALSDDNARQALLDARSLVGLPGLPDGSIGIMLFGASPAPGQGTMNVIDIDTGAVVSRAYVFGFTPGIGGESVPGWDYFDGKIYFSAAAELRTRVEISTFPPDLSSQTILTQEDLTDTHFVAAFYADDALFGKATSLSKWDRMPYSGGKTDPYTDGKPKPGNRLGGHPQSLGLAAGKYWHVGRADVAALPDSGRQDIQVYTSIDVTDVGANGFTSVGLAENFARYQSWNGAANGQYDFNRARTAIIGFPIWTATAGVAAVMSFPLTATDWAEASFALVGTTPFRPDSVIADGRAA